MRQFGTNNLPDCFTMCHESSGTALSEAIGIGKGTATLDDVHDAGVLVDLGHNPGTCHPRMLSALQMTKRNGGKIMAINPLRETGLMRFQHPQQLLQVLTGGSMPLADVHLPVRINGDVAVLQGIMRAMLDAEDANAGTVSDHAFIRAHVGLRSIRRAPRPRRLDAIDEDSGFSRSTVDWMSLVADYDRIRDRIARVIPGFEDFNCRWTVWPSGATRPRQNTWSSRWRRRRTRSRSTTIGRTRRSSTVDDAIPGTRLELV